MTIAGRSGRAILLVWLFLAACGGVNPPGTGEGRGESERPPAPAVSTSFGGSLELQISGGLAGRAEMLHLSGSGSARLSDQRLGTTREFQLDQARLAEVSRLLADLKDEDASPAPWASSRCRDCLIFKLHLPAAGKPRVVQVTSDRLNSSPYRRLITILSGIMNESATGGR